ncbi:MAG: TAT-dependent nitrous-oxide reductase, partial [Zoogloea sp.]|nr:TAT-dependent nitrous-oxide reductase [Zoogloea sp.]
MSNEIDKLGDGQPNLNRRKFLNTAALTGLAGAGLSMGLSACKQDQAGAAAAAPAKQAAGGEYGKYEVPPGQLD